MGKGIFGGGGTYSITYNLPYYFYKLSKNLSMGEMSEKAKTRLLAIELYYKLRNVSLVCSLFNLSRKTFYKWQKRFEAGGRKLFLLEDLPKTPKEKRKTTLDFKKEMLIKKLREKYPTFGKKKLQILFQKEYNCFVSQNHIAYVIKKYNLYFNPKKAKRIRTKKAKNTKIKKIRIDKIDKENLITKEKPFFFCCDTVVLYLSYGVKRYILTAIDYQSKIAYARCYSSKSSLSSFDFILRLSILVNGKISAILSDNGSEFAKYFDEACKKLKITHIFTRIKTPKDNSVNERFNRTLKEEFLAVDEYFEPLLTQSDLSEANNRLTSFLIFYNLKRPYCSLNYQTPIEWYNNHWANKEKGVLPMYPTYTFYCFLIFFMV